VVNTVMGEITDDSNQSASFQWLPVVYGAGGLLGPLLGGGLARLPLTARLGAFPYLLPNVVVATVLAADFIAISLLMKESRKGVRSISSRIRHLLRPRGKSASSPPSLTSSPQARRAAETTPLLRGRRASACASARAPSLLSRASTLSTLSYASHAPAGPRLPLRTLLAPRALALLTTAFVFNVALVAHATLFPTFAALPPPAGRGLGARELGVALAGASLAGAALQLAAFVRVQARLGSRGAARAALLLLALALAATPFVAYRADAPAALFWAELGAVLLAKTVATVLGLTVLAMLITNAAPSAATLGALNGVAQTLAAAGRAVGPFAAGGLFSLVTRRVEPRGVLAWLVFAAIAMLGFFVSYGIKEGKIDVGDEDDDEEAERSELDDEENRTEYG
jgi:hypothetical protein